MVACSRSCARGSNIASWTLHCAVPTKRCVSLGHDPCSTGIIADKTQLSQAERPMQVLKLSQAATIASGAQLQAACGCVGCHDLSLAAKLQIERCDKERNLSCGIARVNAGNTSRHQLNYRSATHSPHLCCNVPILAQGTLPAAAGSSPFPDNTPGAWKIKNNVMPQIMPAWQLSAA